MENASDRAATAQALFGRSARELGSVIDTGADGLSDYQRQAERAGVVIEGLGEKMEQLNDQLELNARVFESARLQGFTDNINLSAEAAREAERAFAAWGETLGRIQANALDLKIGLGGLIASVQEGTGALEEFIATRLGGGLGDRNVPVIPGQGIGTPAPAPRGEFDQAGIEAFRRAGQEVNAPLVMAILDSIAEQRRFFAGLQSSTPASDDRAQVSREGATERSQESLARERASREAVKRLRAERAREEERELERLRRGVRAANDNARRQAAEEARIDTAREREFRRYIRSLEAGNDDYAAAIADSETFQRSGRTGRQLEEAGREAMERIAEGAREGARRAEEEAQRVRERYANIGRAYDTALRDSLLAAMRGGDFSDVGRALVYKMQESAVDSLLEGLGLDSYFEDLFKGLGNEIAGAAGKNLGPGSGLADIFDDIFSSLAGSFGGGGGGLFGGIGSIFGFHRGGVVPGPPSQDVLTLLRGGETVLTEAQADGVGGRGGSTVINYDIRNLDGPTARAAVLQTAPLVESRTRRRIATDAGRPSTLRTNIRR